MSRIFTSAAQLIGHTPLLELSNIQKTENLQARILVKLEGQNPAGSVKDRVALSMIDEAEKQGLLTPASTIIEPTSGNTGIGLSSVAAARGYKVIIVMPDSMSVERRRLMAAYGAQLVLTPGKLGMQGAVDKAKELHEQTPGSFLPGQFVNPANPQAHYLTTGPEIWQDTDGQVDYLISGIGTGGTVTGAGKYLKEVNPQVTVIGLEPDTSPVLTQGHAGPHGIQGIGANFKPDTLDMAVLDEIMPVATQDAYATGRRLAREEGVLCGISAGAALWAALQVAKRPEAAGKTIVAILPDGGDRYLTSPMYAE